MKGDVSDIYESIKDDLIRLHGNWLLFKQLFTVNNENFEIMNKTASGFFRLYQDMSVDNAVVVLSRIIDNPKHRTLPRLVKLIENEVDHNVFEEIETDLEELKIKCADIVEHRHKRVVHKTTIKEEAEEGAKTLPPLTRNLIEGAMTDMAKLMNKILGCYEDVEQYYEPFFTGDSKTLLFYLKKGLEAPRKLRG